MNDSLDPNKLVGRWLTRFDKVTNKIYTFYVMKYFSITGDEEFAYMTYYIVSNVVGNIYFSEWDYTELFTKNEFHTEQSLWTLLPL